MGHYTLITSTFEAFSESQRAEKALPYHAIFCDPPYGMAFMGKEWDDIGGPQAFQQQAQLWGQAMLSLLYPGSLVFMFAGTRMWHRLASGMEDAGFKLWDTIMWLHGTGFPKNLKLKPAWEPILCFRAPGAHSESGFLNIDKARFGTEVLGWHGSKKPKKQGRYPANLVLDEVAAQMVGDPARFFYCAKPSRKEREAGCEILPARPGGSTIKGYTEELATGYDRNRLVHNNHPTVKPVDLNRWIASLLLPPDSVPNKRLLVPFSGSGSEIIGALLAGWDNVTGVEMNADYNAIADARLKHWFSPPDYPMVDLVSTTISGQLS